jgi:hypothetical protein
MDSLVFEGIPPEDDMNEPRLDSVCNSNIHSAEGSLVLGGDIEEGELPSSPDSDSKDEVFSKILEHKVEQQSKSISKAKKESKIHHKISSRSLTGNKCDKSHDESESKKRRLKKEKKSRKEERDADKAQQKTQNLKKFKSSEKPSSDNSPKAPLTPTRPPLPLSTPPSSLNSTSPSNIGSTSPTKCFPSSHQPSNTK